MRVSVLIVRSIDGYQVGVLHITDALTRHWVKNYPTAEVCIADLVEYGLASIFDADDFRNSSIHVERGMLIHHTETDKETLEEAGFVEQKKAH